MKRKLKIGACVILDENHYTVKKYIKNGYITITQGIILKANHIQIYQVDIPFFNVPHLYITTAMVKEVKVAV